MVPACIVHRDDETVEGGVFPRDRGAEVGGEGGDAALTRKVVPQQGNALQGMGEQRLAFATACRPRGWRWYQNRRMYESHRTSPLALLGGRPAASCGRRYASMAKPRVGRDRDRSAPTIGPEEWHPNIPPWRS
jgi:hypothetical protein